MENKSIDILAATNPAFCSLILYSFADGFLLEGNSACPASLLLFPIPLVLSNSIKDTLNRTNVRTGLFSWINSNPSVTLTLSERINDSSEYFRDAFEYAILRKILLPQGNSEIITNSANLNNRFYNDKDLKNYFSLSKRLGHWFGQIGSSSTIFNYLRITI